MALIRPEKLCAKDMIELAYEPNDTSRLGCQLRLSSRDPGGGCDDADTLGGPPSQDASHHQDLPTFLVGNPCKPSFVTGILGGGTTQQIPN